MSNYTIADFWKTRMRVQSPTTGQLVQGWSFVRETLPTFREAPLTQSDELSAEEDPKACAIILVSAPGAVGKSTLARQIAYETGALYVDLATADPVGGNTISGGLAKSGLYTQWASQSVALLIDGLDEARLRVTQEAFAAFLADIAQLSASRSVPTVLFGRTGAIQDAWLLLSDQSINAAVLEIGYYDSQASIEFADARLRALRPNSAHAAVERKAIELLVQKLREQTEVDGDRFAGYAPVLQAVAERVAGEENPAALVAQIEKGAQPVTLQTVAYSILERERGKLSGLHFQDVNLVKTLYLPEEQLDRLVARVYGVLPPSPPAMRPADAKAYAAALETWVGEHPFLNGGYEASSAVFEAVISTRALKSEKSANAAVQRELGRGQAANPFLAEFYLPSPAPRDEAGSHLYLPPEHIGIVYASLRARLSLGDSASLLIEGSEEAEEEDALRAEVEVTLARRGAERQRVLRFDTEQTGVLRLGAYIEDVELLVPHTHVEIGPGREGVLVAPVSIQSSKLSLTVDKVIVECPAGMNDAAVFLQADNFDGAKVTSVPAIRGGVSLSVVWPNAQSFPWTSFATTPTQIDDPRIDEALRRLRRIVTAFRSHSKGDLARYKDKIEHSRMTKGSGAAVLKHMLKEGILSLQGRLYYLDSDALASKAGANYTDCMARHFNSKTIEFVKGALNN